jgi:hypothetical protein
MTYYIEYLRPADAFIKECWVKAGMWDNYKTRKHAEEDLVRYKKLATKIGIYAKDFRIVEAAE